MYGRKNLSPRFLCSLACWAPGRQVERFLKESVCRAPWELLCNIHAVGSGGVHRERT